MRNTLKSVALLGLVVAWAACGQIGQHQPGDTAGLTSVTPLSPLPSSAPSTSPLPDPSDPCAVAKALTSVDSQVSKLIKQMEAVEGSEDFVTVVNQLVAGFSQAQAALAQIPAATSDPGITRARGLLGQIIDSYITGMQELAEGFQKSDEQMLLEAAVKLDAAQKSFDQQYVPAVYQQSGCF